jgi:hypothetical protein
MSLDKRGVRVITEVRWMGVATALMARTGFVLAFSFCASTTPATAGQARNTSSSMLVSVEVIRPAKIDYQLDREGSATARVENAVARVTRSVRTSEGKEAPLLDAGLSDQRRTVSFTVEY